ncbi:MAG: hypothetical protein V4722_17690 [Bacteroidota bacterium]
MKKLLSACLLLCVFTLTRAQIIKGNKLIGGSLASGNVLINEGVGLSIQVNPTAGIMLTNQWMGGTGITLGAVVSDGFLGIAGINPFVRYYMHNKNKADSLYRGFFLQGTVGVVTVFGDELETSVQPGIGVGYSRFITPDIGLELATTASFIKVLSDYDGTINIGFSFGLQIVLGKNVHLFRKK